MQKSEISPRKPISQSHLTFDLSSITRHIRWTHLVRFPDLARRPHDLSHLTLHKTKVSWSNFRVTHRAHLHCMKTHLKHHWFWTTIYTTGKTHKNLLVLQFFWRCVQSANCHCSACDSTEVSKVMWATTKIIHRCFESEHVRILQSHHSFSLH